MNFQEHETEQRLKRIIRHEIQIARHRRLEDEASDRRLTRAISEMEANERYWSDQMKGKWRTK